jgi:predicted transcriptional regulator YheO
MTSEVEMGGERRNGDTLVREEEAFTEGERIKLSPGDREVLKALEPVVDAVAALFGPNCEVLLHSLEDLSSSVMKIANGHVTGRAVGAPMTDLGMQTLKRAMASQSEIVRSYYSRSKDGKTLKSVTALIRRGHRPIGMFCVNVNLSAPLLEVVSQFFPAQQTEIQDSPEHFLMSSEELVHRSFEKARAAANGQRGLSALARSKLIVKGLYDQGIFDVKGAAGIVAREMGVSRYTIYNYIRDARTQECQP